MDSSILYIRWVGCFDIGLQPSGARAAGGMGCFFTDGGGPDYRVSLTWKASKGATNCNVYGSETSGGYHVLIDST